MEREIPHRSPTARPTSGARWRSPGAVAVGMLVLIAAFYLLREHWSHVAGFWPYLLLLACPLLHLFGHGGHKHGQ